MQDFPSNLRLLPIGIIEGIKMCMSDLNLTQTVQKNKCNFFSAASNENVSFVINEQKMDVWI